MRFIIFYFIFGFNLFSQEKMNIEIQKIIEIPDFPSGSGIAFGNQKLYAIGDDSPFLYILNDKLQIEEKIQLLYVDSEHFKGNRIKKKKKPDFETLEMISEKELVIFGSGSKSPQRDIFIRVFLSEKNRIETHSISAFYEYLQKNPLLENSELNIEATTYQNGFLYLFNRANNVIIKFDYQDFIKYLSGGNFPKIETKRIFLPEIQGFEAGFSGATMFCENKILFTASIEATNDSYNDGEIIGSLVGIIDISDFENAKLMEYDMLSFENSPLKVESVTMNKNNEILLICDDDNGNTQIINAIMK